MRLSFLAAFVVAISLFVPLTHASVPSPGIPMLFFSSQGGPYQTGENVQIQFKVVNWGADAIAGLTLDPKPSAAGWSVSQRSVQIGSVEPGEKAQRQFSLRVTVGSPSFPAIVFTAKSNSHITLDFPASITVASPVTPDIVKRSGEDVSTLLEVATQWGKYAVYRIGNLYFPSIPTGIKNDQGLHEILKGYFVRDYLGSPSGRDLLNVVSSLVEQLSAVSSDAQSVRSAASDTYTFSVLMNTYSTTLYGFLTWVIPFSQWTLNLVQDRSVADLLAWAIQQFAGLNVSANDIVRLAEALVRIGQAGTLGTYVSGLQGLSNLVSALVSASVPELRSLDQVLTSASQTLNLLKNIANTINQLIGGPIQQVTKWVRTLVDKLYETFQRLIDWIRKNIPIVADAINNAIAWLGSKLTSLLSRFTHAADSIDQTKATTDSAESHLSDMSTSVQRSSTDAWAGLSARLQEVGSQTKQKFDSFCTIYSPVLGQLQGITHWTQAAVLVSSLIAPHIVPVVPMAIQGISLIANGIATGCSASLTGRVDPVELISLATGAVLLLGDVFPAEERDFNAVGSILSGIAAAVTTYRQISDAVGSVLDLSEISAIVSKYDSASSNGLADFGLSTPDYVGAVGEIASISGLPSIDAINTLLSHLEPFSEVKSKFYTFVEEGMVAPDLESRVGDLQRMGQNIISRIAAGDYSALTEAATMTALAAQLGSDIDVRYQQFHDAKAALGRLNEAVVSLHGCGFLWVQPDSAQLRQVDDALQRGRSDFSNGQYLDVTQSADVYVGQASQANELCRSSVHQAKLEVAGAGIIAIVAILAFAINRTRKTKSDSEGTKKEAESGSEATKFPEPAEKALFTPTIPESESEAISVAPSEPPRVQIVPIDETRPGENISIPVRGEAEIQAASVEPTVPKTKKGKRRTLTVESRKRGKRVGKPKKRPGKRKT